MALSNIFREPRREITESAAGTLVVLAVGCVIACFGYLIAERWLQSPPIPFAASMLIGCSISLASAAGCFLFAMITHLIGEEICDALERRGLRLRPRNRR